MKKGLLLMLSIILMLTMCKKKEEITTQGLPVVTTHEVTEIGISSAICGGEVTDDGGAEVTARGVCWSTNPDPTITDAHTTDGSGLGGFTSNITELDAGTVYYVRAYATNEVGTVYGEEKQFTTKEGAKVTTKDVTGITETTAICGGEVTDDGGAEVTAKGVCWSTNENPTIADSHTMNGSGLGSFTSNITGLGTGNTYYVRAYATTMDGTSYGIQKSFTTGNVHECVDLGLPSGLKWATCNVGASTPFGYGNYYAWGEIEPKESYDEETSVTWGQEMEDISGNPQYDVARANWGEGWRMPTREEFEELIEECEWEWTNEGGNDGYRVTGPNGNSIFLPDASYFSWTGLHLFGGGYYWSSTPDESGTQSAYNLRFSSDSYTTTSGYYRYFGLSVRPVLGIHITTNDVTEITETSAICGGNVADYGGTTVTARGVCWSTSENPTITDSHTTDGSGTGSFTSNMTGLSSGTPYYVRAYATTVDGTSYGLQKYFTTNGQINGYDFVDLGLSSGLKWATYNIGANSSSEYGNYYAWGEIEPKENYNEETSVTWGQEMEDISGNPQYDAARAIWGSTWRIPSREEFNELIEECEWEWTNEGGHNGYRVTGPNGNSIFLPAAGGRFGTSLNYAGSYGYYWSSMPNGNNTQNAYYLYFNSGYHNMYYYNRYYGLSVRPVSD